MTFWQIELVLSVMVIDSNYLVLYIFFLNHYLTKRFYFCLFLVILLFHMKGAYFTTFPVSHVLICLLVGAFQSWK
jgi:hypothetical protein